MSEDDTSTETSASDQRVPWRRLGRIAGLVALLVIVIPFVIYAVPQTVGAEQSYVVLSGSMEPAMSPGDVIIVNGVSAASIQEGEVITYTGGDGKTPTTHRVQEVVEQDSGVAFRTKGDANEDPDSQLVTPGQVEGKVMSVGGYLFVIPYIGYVIQFMQTTVGFVALFVVPIALLVVSELWNIVGDSNSDAEASPDAEAEPADGSGATAAVSADEETQSTADVATADVEAEDSSAASTADAAAEDSKTDEKALTFSALELQLGLGALGAFLAYSLWVAYAAIEIFESGVIWASTVAAAVAVAFLLFLGLYINGLRAGDAEDTDSSSVESTSAADGGKVLANGGVSHEENPGGETPASDSADSGESDEFTWRPQASDSSENDVAGRQERSEGGEANE